MKPQEKLLFLFYQKILSYQKDEMSKTDVVDKAGTLFFWDEKIC